MTAIYLTGSFLIAGLLFVNRNIVINNVLLILFALLQIIFTLYEFLSVGVTDLWYFTNDSAGLLFLSTLTVIGIPALFHSYLYIRRHDEPPKSRSIFYSALVLLITSVSAAYLANHIAVVWIFAELSTLSASALIYHHRNKLALEGTWKYVFMSAVSITFVFIGILFLSLSMQGTGSSDLSYSNLMAKSDQLNPFWLRLAFVFIFTGFTVKLGLVPMYAAGVDAKDKAPAPTGALLSSALMNMGFVGVFRFYIIIAHTQVHYWANMIIFISAILSIFIATVHMTRVINIKRMFAYSSIEHMGLVMLGLAAGRVGYYAAVLHLILHALIKSSLFFQFNQLYTVFQNKNIEYMGNYFKYNATGAVVFLFAFISATAMPPSGLFVSEFLIFRALFEGKYYILLFVTFFLLTIILWALARNFLKILFLPVAGFDDTNVPKISPWESSTQFILLFTAIWLGLNPPEVFVGLIQESVVLLQN